MKKKLIVASSRFPYPVVGGDRLRIYQLCKALSKSYDLTLVCLCEKKSELEFVIPNDSVFKKIERIYHSRWRSWISCLLALPTSTPLQVAYYKNSLFEKTIQDISADHDALLAHLIRTAESVKNVELPKFLEMTDAISLNYERVKNTKAIGFFDLRKFIFEIECNRLNTYEKLAASYFDQSFMVSDVDRQYLFKHDEETLSRVHVFSIGIDLEKLKYSFKDNNLDIIFIGNMSSLQNYDAALLMASEIMPRILKVLPLAKLKIIGRITEAAKNILSSYENVIVTGEVESVSEHVSSGAVGVCPVRLGAGTQYKVLEYMAFGLPVVSTNMGLEGFHAIAGNDLIVADDLDDFAAGVIRLITDRRYAKSIAESARKYVEINHDWESMLQPMVSIIEGGINR